MPSFPEVGGKGTGRKIAVGDTISKYNNTRKIKKL
jgi:hypothetical protein